MKALDWVKYLELQYRSHNKVVFTVTELANVSDVALNSMNVQVGRLVRRGIVTRYANGRYGLPGTVTPEILVPSLDSHAYISGAYALYRHNLITQAQTEICCVTNRRHNRSRSRDTPIGRLVFVCVRPPIYAAPDGGGAMAGPEQALCDYVYLLGRRGLDVRTLATFRGLNRLNADTLATVVARYPATVSRNVEEIVG